MNTLTTTDLMYLETDEDIADFVFTKLIEQGARCGNSNMCYYRRESYFSEIVHRCAMGWLIADTHYNSSFEGGGLYDVIGAVRDSLTGAHITTKTEDMFKVLVSIHDRAEPKYWPAIRDLFMDGYFNPSGEFNGCDVVSANFEFESILATVVKDEKTQRQE